MCETSFWRLESWFLPPTSHNTYTCEVTNAPRMRDGIYKSLIKLRESNRDLNGWQFFYFFIFLKQQHLWFFFFFGRDKATPGPRLLVQSFSCVWTLILNWEKVKEIQSVCYHCLNNSFQCLNNIIRIFTYFFTHTYF